MADLQSIYVRTPAGLEEIKARALHLTREQRNLLILLDGRSPLADLVKTAGCAPEQISDAVEPLIRHGLIVPAAGASAAGQRRLGAHTQALASLAQQVFGPRAGPVVHKLENVGDTPAALLAATEAAAKLAKLTIDESKAQAFLAEARKLISGWPSQNP